MGLFSKTSGKGWSFDKKSGRLTISGDLGNAFRPFEKIADKVTSVVALKGSRIINGKYLFMDMDKLVSADLADLDTSMCETMSAMFMRCYSMASLDPAKWDVSNVKTMADMFHSCRSLSSLDLTNWDISNVENMSGMFDGCSNLVSIKTGPAWIPKKLTDTICMFGSCLKLRQLDINSWAPAHLEYCHMMFEFCRSLTELDLSSMNVTNVKSFHEMFNDCSSLRTLNLGGWSTENANDMTELFYKCRKLEALDLTGWHISEGTKIKDMFDNVPKNVKISYSDPTVARRLPQKPLKPEEVKKLFSSLDDEYAKQFASGINRLSDYIRNNDMDSEQMDSIFEKLPFSAIMDTSIFKEYSYDDKAAFLANSPKFFREAGEVTGALSSSKPKSEKSSAEANSDEFYREPVTAEDIQNIFGKMDHKTAEQVANEINHTADFVNDHDCDEKAVDYFFKSFQSKGLLSSEGFDGFSYEKKLLFLKHCQGFYKELSGSGRIRSIYDPITPEELKELFVDLDDEVAEALADRINYAADYVKTHKDIDSKTLDSLFESLVISKIDDIADLFNKSSYEKKIEVLAGCPALFREMKRKFGPVTSNESQPAPDPAETGTSGFIHEYIKPEDIKDLFGGLDPETAELMAHDINFVADFAKNNENIDSETLDVLFLKLPFGDYLKLDNFRKLSYGEKVDFLAGSPEFFKALNKTATQTAAEKPKPAPEPAETVSNKTAKEPEKKAEPKPEPKPAETPAENIVEGKGWSFDRNSGRLTLNGDLGNVYRPFKEFENEVRSVEALNGSRIKDGSFLFSDMKNLVKAELAELDVSECEDISYMFSKCESLTSLDLNSWNVANVKKMSNMFSNCKSLASLNISSWEVSIIKDTRCMFYGCESLSSLDLSSWDVSDVESMESMFSGCKSLASLDLNSWNVANVKEMYYMFGDCYKLCKLDISSWPSVRLDYCFGMFNSCRALEELDLSFIDVSKADNLYAMFRNCSNLHSLNLSGWSTDNVNDISLLFFGCTKLETLDLTGWHINEGTYAEAVFAGVPQTARIFTDDKFLLRLRPKNTLDPEDIMNLYGGLDDETAKSMAHDINLVADYMTSQKDVDSETMDFLFKKLPLPSSVKFNDRSYDEKTDFLVKCPEFFKMLNDAAGGESKPSRTELTREPLLPEELKDLFGGMDDETAKEMAYDINLVAEIMADDEITDPDSLAETDTLYVLYRKLPLYVYVDNDTFNEVSVEDTVLFFADYPVFFRFLKNFVSGNEDILPQKYDELERISSITRELLEDMGLTQENLFKFNKDLKIQEKYAAEKADDRYEYTDNENLQAPVVSYIKNINSDITEEQLKVLMNKREIAQIQLDSISTYYEEDLVYISDEILNYRLNRSDELIRRCIEEIEAGACELPEPVPKAEPVPEKETAPARETKKADSDTSRTEPAGDILKPEDVKDLFGSLDEKTVQEMTDEINLAVELVKDNNFDSETLDFLFGELPLSVYVKADYFKKLSVEEKTKFIANSPAFFKALNKMAALSAAAESKPAPESSETGTSGYIHEYIKPEDIKDLFGGLDPETAKLMAHDINFVADYAKNNENIDSETLDVLFLKLPFGDYLKLDNFRKLSYGEKVDFLAGSQEFFKALNKMAGKK